MPWRWRPLLPCPIVPAKKIPGTVVLSHHGVWAGSRLAPKVATPRSGRSSERTDEPGRRDDLVDLDLEVAAPVGATQEQVEAAVAAGAGSTRSSAASRIDTPPPRTWSS